jgi:hypothetical protein
MFWWFENDAYEASVGKGKSKSFYVVYEESRPPWVEMMKKKKKKKKQWDCFPVVGS